MENCYFPLVKLSLGALEGEVTDKIVCVVHQISKLAVHSNHHFDIVFNANISDILLSDGELQILVVEVNDT